MRVHVRVCVCACMHQCPGKISEGGHGEEKRWREKCAEEEK